MKRTPGSRLRIPSLTVVALVVLGSSVLAVDPTSIVDVAFGPDGILYVVELDENTWAAIEFQLGGAGGTVNACDPATWSCSERNTGLPIPMAVAIDKSGALSAAILALVPGAADVIPLP